MTNRVQQLLNAMEWNRRAYNSASKRGDDANAARYNANMVKLNGAIIAATSWIKFHCNDELEA
jgi:hypothetical protein